MKSESYILEKWNKILRVGMPAESREMETKSKHKLSCSYCSIHWSSYLACLWCKFDDIFNVYLNGGTGEDGKRIFHWIDLK